MSLRKIGFFYKSSGDEAVPGTLVESRGLLALALRSRVATYLRSGTVLGISDGSYKDWFNPSNVAGKKELLTDGLWLWPGSFAYYVERYGVAVPQDFLDHMAAQGWSARPLRAEELQLAADSLGELGFVSGDQPPR
jgi:hypothetical protein